MSCNYLNLEVKTLNCNWLGIDTKIGLICFLTTLQNSLNIFDKVLLWTIYKSPMLCNRLLLSNLCDDIATLSCANKVILKWILYLFKYGPNFSHKNLNVMYFTQGCFVKWFSVQKPNNKWSTNPYIRFWLHKFLSLCPMLLLTQLKILKISHSPCKNNAWICTTCFTSMYKYMYNHKSIIRLLLFSILKFKENARKQNMKPR